MAVGTALAVVGGLSAVQGISASRRAKKLSQAQMADWQRLYGGVEQDLADFFNNLTPDTYEAQGLEAQQVEFQKAQDNISAFLAERGLGQSGVAIESQQDLELANAQMRAKIRREAPFKVAEVKQSFLQTGIGEKQQIQADQINAAKSEAAGWYQGATSAFAGLASGVASGDITSVFGMEVGKAASAGAGVSAVGSTAGIGASATAKPALTSVPWQELT